MSDLNSPDIVETVVPQSREDSWQKIKPLLTPFRPEGCDVVKLEANEAALERDRVKYVSTLLAGYSKEKGYTIHPNTTPGHEDIFGLDFPYEAKRIAFPRHIMTKDPNEDIRGKQLRLRRDIPILYILAGFVHEATHLDRYFANPKVARVMRQMVEDKYLEPEKIDIQISSEGKITPETIEEEAATDVQAFFLLKDLGIEVEPENYCTYVGRGQFYEQIVYDRIKSRMSGDKSQG